MAKKIKPKNIVEGFTKMILNTEDDFSAERKNICNTCPFRKNIFCGECGCVISAKVKVKEEYCPKNKWNENKMIVNNVGLLITNLSEGLVSMTHIDKTATVDFSFNKTLKFDVPVTFKFAVKNERGNYDFKNSAMSGITLSPGCGSCTKIVSKTPSTIGDGEEFEVEVRYTPPKTGNVRKSIKLKFNKTETLIINFKSNVTL